MRYSVMCTEYNWSRNYITVVSNKCKLQTAEIAVTPMLTHFSHCILWNLAPRRWKLVPSSSCLLHLTWMYKCCICHPCLSFCLPACRIDYSSYLVCRSISFTLFVRQSNVLMPT